jgi:hypothetical protein
MTEQFQTAEEITANWKEIAGEQELKVAAENMTELLQAMIRV